MKKSLIVLIWVSFFIAGLLSCGKDTMEENACETLPDPTTELEYGLDVGIGDVFNSPVFVRQGREIALSVTVDNKTIKERQISFYLKLHSKMSLLGSCEQIKTVNFKAFGKETLTWNVRFDIQDAVKFEIKAYDQTKFTRREFKMPVREAYQATVADYVPEPTPVGTGDYLVGCFRCPLWYEAPTQLPKAWTWCATTWSERMPVLGTYNENNPEVLDWELKWASEHGISFFADCWYRKAGNDGSANVEGWLEHFVKRMIDPKTRYRNKVKFALVWENSKTTAGHITGVTDFTDNLVPYWINTYFGADNYMKIGGKPLFFIYNPMEFINQCGSQAAAGQAIAVMRQKAVAAGYPGLYVMTVHNVGLGRIVSQDYSDISYLKSVLGFDALTAYNLPTFSGLMPSANPPQANMPDLQRQAWYQLGTITKGQMRVWPVASQGYDSRPWNGGAQGWMLDPEYYKQVLEKAKTFVDNVADSGDDLRLVMLDNWNEFAEGHMIAPSLVYGFGHLDAVRSVFAPNAAAHTDLVPEDVGLGGYKYPIGEN